MAPEYPMYGTISYKYDVYGYGVVILEIVSGKKNAGHNFNKEQLEFIVDEVNTIHGTARRPFLLLFFPVIM